MFTCIECEDKYIPDVNGDAEERLCYHCMLDDEEGKRMNDVICSGCKKKNKYDLDSFPIKYHMWARNDAYGIYTGIYCDDCYDSDSYPYRKDNYHDPAYCGERMEPDDY